MNYTFHQLSIFIKLVDLKSVTKTAEELHLTQPAVSIQLKNFQDQFTIPLFEIVSRKVFITEFGHEIAAVAERIMEEARSIDYLQDRYEGQLAGTLKIAIVSTAKYVMPYFLSQFLEEHPNVDLKMEVTNKQEVIKSLERNEVDFAMVSVIPKKLKLEKIPLLKNRLFLVGGTTIKLEKELLSFNELQKVPLILREPGSATRAAMEDFLRTIDIRSYKKIELMSNEAVKQAVMAGLGISIMPLLGIKNELDNGSLKILEFKGLPLITEWNVVWLKAKKPSRIATAFTEYLVDNKDSIIAQYFKSY
jgi:DNA-binding transcriptional LysR family regulator